MDTADKKVLNLAMLRLTSEIKLTTTFKSCLVSENILPEDKLDKIFELQDDEAILRLIQNLKKLDGVPLDKFIRVLRTSEYNDLAEHLLDCRDPDRIPKRQASQKTDLDEELKRTPSEATGPERSNLTMAPTTGTRTIASGLTGTVSRGSSVEDIRQCMKQVGRKYRKWTRSEGDVVIVSPYISTVRKFEEGEHTDLPGPLENIETDRKAVPSNRFWTIPTDYSAVICKLLGGKPQLKYTIHKGIAAFVTLTGRLTHIKVDIVLDTSRKVIGYYWLGWGDLLHDCVAAALGYYPTTISYVTESHKEIGEERTVEEWFNSAQKGAVLISV